jgi:hypothetical protein
MENSVAIYMTKMIIIMIVMTAMLIMLISFYSLCILQLLLFFLLLSPLLHVGGDGPSLALLKYMNTFNFEAPKEWKNYRPLTSK